VAAAQPTQEFTGKVDVAEVLLDVVVTDRDGNVILGLQPEDFVVADGDSPVTVRSATFYSNRAFLESAALSDRLGLSPDEIPVDRYFILFFHDPRGLFPSLISEQLDALRWTRRWVHQELLPNDYVAVLSYDHKLKVHQDFTTDNDAILRALDDVAKGGDPGENWPSRIEAASGPSLRQNLPRGDELRKSSRTIYSALETLADATGYIVGRKNLLMFGVGFGEPGDFSETTGYLNRSGSGLSNWGTYRVDQRYYPRMMEALNDSNVAVYTISLLKNMRNENDAQGILGNSMSLLAENTGGRYYGNFLNFRDPLRDVVQDNNGYYLLSYPAQKADAGSGYRQVTVTTANPDFVVRARQGYLPGG
jgi:VWFA-related protein